MTNYPEGSIWRKWDLHIHTPFTKLNNNYKNSSDVWDRFCDEIERSDISVFGITDYFSLDNYFVFIEKFKNKYPESKKKFFPSIEFRIDSKNKEDDHIQLHVIFSNSLDKSKLENFLTRLELVSTDNSNLTNKYCTNNDLSEVGYNKAMITLKALINQLKDDFDEGAFLIAGVANGYGSLRPGENDGRGAEYAKEIDKICHIFFGNQSNIEFYLNKKNGREQYNLPPKPVVQGSDCHSFEDISSKLGKFFTWIKADPTFEGLKQIIYEPEERVKIQENNPEYDFDKPTFLKIRITQPLEVFNGEKVKFDKTELPLNKNLVTIIGGRGAGKSVLLNYIANTFKKEILAYKRKENPPEFKDSDNFIIEWQKNNTLNPEIITFNSKNKGDLNLIFIEQGKLKNISDYRTLANEIKKLLRIETLQFDERSDKEIKELLNDIKKLKDWFEDENEKGEKINDKKFNESKKQEAENLLKTITTRDNRQNLEIYTSNIKTINNCENILTSLNDIKNSLAKFQVDTNNTINNINSDIEKEINDLSIPKIDFESQTNAIKIIKEKITTIIKDKKGKNSEIKKEFERQGYKGDLETLLRSAEKYQKEIQDARVKLKAIEEKEKQLKEKIQQRNNLAEKLKNEYERQKNEIDGAWNNLLNKFSEEQGKVMSKILEKREISINGIIDFDLKNFNEKLKEYLDLRIYKNLSRDNIGISSRDDYWNFIKNRLQDFIEGKDAKNTKKPLETLFFNLQERRDYLYVIPQIRFMNKTLDQLSVGQRGTLYLLLQLATNTFSSPLFFDQPEDDLDNEFITKELVNLFKELKLYRQIIISTHNANLVVTADAEQVIIAKNKDECLSYTSGALENNEIIEFVCNILEGGKNAFEKRKNKYHF